jgi:hypothetical protein
MPRPSSCNQAKLHTDDSPQGTREMVWQDRSGGGGEGKWRATGNQGRYEYTQYSAPTHDSSGLYRKHTSAHACVPELHLRKLCLKSADSGTWVCYEILTVQCSLNMFLPIIAALWSSTGVCKFSMKTAMDTRLPWGQSKRSTPLP